MIYLFILDNPHPFLIPSDFQDRSGMIKVCVRVGVETRRFGLESSFHAVSLSSFSLLLLNKQRSGGHQMILPCQLFMSARANLWDQHELSSVCGAVGPVRNHDHVQSVMSWAPLIRWQRGTS